MGTTPRFSSTISEKLPRGRAPVSCSSLVIGVITPDVSSGILESITRDALIVLVLEVLGLEVVERHVDRTELYLADEVFTCGTAAEVTPDRRHRQLHRWRRRDWVSYPCFGIGVR